MAVYEVVIDEKRCKGCELCVKACNKGCIEISKEFNDAGYYFPCMKADMAAECTGCGACVKRCPDFEVTVYEILEETG